MIDRNRNYNVKRKNKMCTNKRSCSDQTKSCDSHSLNAMTIYFSLTLSSLSASSASSCTCNRIVLWAQYTVQHSVFFSVACASYLWEKSNSRMSKLRRRTLFNRVEPIKCTVCTICNFTMQRIRILYIWTNIHSHLAKMYTQQHRIWFNGKKMKQKK